MDFPTLRDHVVQLFRFSSRIQGLSAINSQKIALFRKWLTPLFLIMISLVFGYWAEERAESEATQDWMRSHPPSPLMWRYGLETNGLHHLQDQKTIQRTARGLPAMIDDPGSTWMTHDGDWVATVIHSEAPDSPDSPLLLYCRNCKSTPKDWELAGQGWLAFEKVMRRINPSQISKSLSPLSGKKAPPADPREIRY